MPEQPQHCQRESSGMTSMYADVWRNNSVRVCAFCFADALSLLICSLCYIWQNVRSAYISSLNLKPADLYNEDFLRDVFNGGYKVQSSNSVLRESMRVLPFRMLMEYLRNITFTQSMKVPDALQASTAHACVQNRNAFCLVLPASHD